MVESQRKAGEGKDASPDKGYASAAAPAIALPKGGGAIRGIGEKFAANPVTGTGSMTVPIATSPGRSGFGPQLSLAYDSGAGNGPFGLGWQLSIPTITRKTDKGLPRYHDEEDSDTFILSGAEDLVPLLNAAGEREKLPRKLNGVDYTVERYRPRIEGLFARIEQWRERQTGRIHWRLISKDNITSMYGASQDNPTPGCIADPDDPADPSRIFCWFLETSYDDKGNLIIYEYKAEDRANVVPSLHEHNRTVGANRYLKRITYGYQSPYYPDPASTQATPLPADWHFQIVFDYGEHDLINPQVKEDITWPSRPDAFSSYRAGFEIRTYRLCRRALMFHRFAAELDPGPCLVRSTDFVYSHEQDPGNLLNPIYVFLTSATQTGYIKKTSGNGYDRKSLPQLEFVYTKATVDEAVHDVDSASLEHLPIGLHGVGYQWVDLDSEGLPGILTEQAEAWFYKRNLSNLPGDDNGAPLPISARFAPLELVATRPSLADLRGGRQQLMDLAGDGQLYLVQFNKPVPGYYERDRAGQWRPFAPFSFSPNVDWNDPNLKSIDLDGDGHADILIAEDELFTWYPSRAKDGFGPAETVRKAGDEDRGPTLVFADGTQSVYLADISGDGLTDLVRIRNGEVCYWPNLGYGRFGAKITMDSAPLFDYPDQFDHKRIRLADIDGSGTTDIIYLGRDRVTLYFNQSGNSWSAGRPLAQLAAPDNLASVVVLDLLGNGTACLVWSSPLPGDVQQPMRYVDLMGGQKPHLLIAAKNNLGAETKIQYAASTRFYLRDRAAGTPWITRLPFPVHVVERVETYDRLSRNRFVTRYAYHHGFFDGSEREFRGFGMVEQWDTEEILSIQPGDSTSEAIDLDAASYVPPVRTKTWFHTGVFIDREHISDFFANKEYYKEPGLSQVELAALLLPDTVLPADLTTQEQREACRALKGAILRQEIYAEDDSDKRGHPYTVSERNYTIKRLQPVGQNRHAVFLTHPRETISYHYERSVIVQVPDTIVADPRVSHELVLEVDVYGNVERSAAVGYGRHHADTALDQGDRDKQKRTLITYTENAYTNPIEEGDAYRVPLLSETRTYELTSPALAGSKRFAFELVDSETAAAAPLKYEQVTDGSAQKRLIERVRTLYRDNDLGPLALGELASLALPWESYKQALTPGLLDTFIDKIAPATLVAIAQQEGQFRDLDGDGVLWIPSGRVFFSPVPKPTPNPLTDNPQYGRQHFYLPQAAHDPFGSITRLAYDDYNLLVVRSEDAVENIVQAIHDYRVLQPQRVTDPNGNRAEVAFDILGMVAGTAVLGKVQEPDGKPKGDSLQGFAADLTDIQVEAFFADPLGAAPALLAQATTRIIYDVDRVQQIGTPAFGAALAREKHVSDLQPGEQARVQVSFSYSDGFGREIQKKIQAEPGDVEGVPANPRWVGSGWTIFNNKGKPAKQYEPFFSTTHEFQFANIVGVSSTLFYDPVERVVATLHPNYTYEKVVFDPWRQATWDVNDTVLQADPKDDPDVGAFFRRLDEADYLPTWHERRKNGQLGAAEQAAATKAAAHANTPTVAHFDSLGRTLLTIADNGPDGTYATRVELDIEGNQRSVIDARGHTVITGLTLGLALWLAFEPAYWLWFGPVVGLVVGLAFGGYAVLSHIALRLVLWGHGAMPLNLVPFLDHCVERIFLRKVGGGYIFVHRMLLEHFASLDSSPYTDSAPHRQPPTSTSG